MWHQTLQDEVQTNALIVPLVFFCPINLFLSQLSVSCFQNKLVGLTPIIRMFTPSQLERIFKPSPLYLIACQKRWRLHTTTFPAKTFVFKMTMSVIAANQFSSISEEKQRKYFCQQNENTRRKH